MPVGGEQGLVRVRVRVRVSVGVRVRVRIRVRVRVRVRVRAWSSLSTIELAEGRSGQLGVSHGSPPASAVRRARSAAEE